MADDYYLEHMTGVRQTREEFLAGLRSGTFNYYSAEHDAIEVRVVEDSAEMVGKSRVTAAVYGGSKKRSGILIFLLLVVIAVIVFSFVKKSGHRGAVAGIREPIQKETKGYINSKVDGYDIHIEYKSVYQV